jgi:NADPH:quinone reductase-like Zn-dependent oxidoreductase
MKAIVYDHYGSPDVLELRDVAKPVPSDDEVLVRVHAASINSWDADMVRGEPFIIRLWGLTRPRYRTPGADIAGVVETVGRNVRRFKVGDEVYGDLAESGFGAFAEYARAHEKSLLIKPPNMSFLQAAAIPQAGALASQAITAKGGLQSGEHLLLNGAAGGVGTLALQIAKACGAVVTVVDRGPKLPALLALGADHVIDYELEDFTHNGILYNRIVDMVSNRSLNTYKRCLTERGVFLMIGGTMSSIFQAMVFGPIASSLGHKKLGILAYKANQGLDLIADLFTSGKLVPAIDKIFPLAQTSEAFRHFSRNEFKGKIVISVSGES